MDGAGAKKIVGFSTLGLPEPEPPAPFYFVGAGAENEKIVSSGNPAKYKKAIFFQSR